MKILVGIKGPGRSENFHRKLSVRLAEAASLSLPGSISSNIASGSILHFQASGGALLIEGAKLPHTSSISETRINTKNSKGKLSVQIFAGAQTLPIHRSNYVGSLIVRAAGDKISARLEVDLEDYVHGVLNSEVPGSYSLEALKAQSVLARTYALRPRINHSPDNYQVCDSYLCCQAFNGIDSTLTPIQKQAIKETDSQILSYQGKPVLALFSACAGGHTEDYSNCFSDPETNQFPGTAIPYLRGIAEGKLPEGFPSEQALRILYKEQHPNTIDAWSKSFRWQLTLSGDALEAHMHHQISVMKRDPQFAPFIAPPKSGQFGQIKSFSVTRRGPSSTAMTLLIDTSSGTWSVQKELPIRSIFANPEAKLKRLKSAKIFFDHAYDPLGLLSGLTIYGFGFGHGVGLQQTGAQALALKGQSYKQILARYYPGTELQKLEA